MEQTRNWHIQLVVNWLPDFANMPAIRPLRPELQKIAIEELNENPSRIDQDIAALRLWIQQQPHLKARTDDQFLVNFLRGCKYSLEKTKAKIDRFYTLRTKYPEIYLGHNVDVDKLLKLFRIGQVLCSDSLNFVLKMSFAELL